jgi:hypothetical protein
MTDIQPSKPYNYIIRLDKSGLIFDNPFILMYALKHYNGDEGSLERYRILNNPLNYPGRRNTDQSNEEINKEIDYADEKKETDGTKSVETEIMQPFFICENLNRKFRRTFSIKSGPSEKFNDCSISISKTRTGYFLEITKHAEIGTVKDIGNEIDQKIGGIKQGLKSCKIDIYFKRQNDVFCLDVVEFFSKYFKLSRIESDLKFREFRKEDYFWLSRELFEHHNAKVLINPNNHVSINSNISLLNIIKPEFKNQYLVEKSQKKPPTVRIDLLPDIDKLSGLVLTDLRGIELILESVQKIEDKFKGRY